jgi:hypothetical protein
VGILTLIMAMAGISEAAALQFKNTTKISLDRAL